MPQTLGSGSVWDIAFSNDPDQRFLYVADGVNQRVHVIDRESLEILTAASATAAGSPGSSTACTTSPSDSQGNIYTTETYEGKRLQKFVYRGDGPIPSAEQGALWPQRG
jgi:sugar lactone lactonase YvrE